MKTLSWVVAILLFCCPPSTLQASSSPKEPVSVYIQQSSQGTLEKASDLSYILTLKGNSLNLVYFTDQPHRTTGEKSLRLYFENWQKNAKLKTHPPTAFLNFNTFEPKEKEGVTPDILLLEEPFYDEEKDTLTFKVKPLHDQPMQVGKFDHVVIIYDQDD